MAKRPRKVSSPQKSPRAPKARPSYDKLALSSLNQAFVSSGPGGRVGVSSKGKKGSGRGRILYSPTLTDQELHDWLGGAPVDWERSSWANRDQEMHRFVRGSGQNWVLRPKALDAPQNSFPRQPGLELSEFGRGRDLLGALVNQLRESPHAEFEIEFRNVSDQEQEGALLGLELARYRFKDAIQNDWSKWPRFVPSASVSIEAQRSAAALGRGVNLARHLVNLPPSTLHPVTYADQIRSLFKKEARQIKVEIWDERRLAKEGMNLHLAVGEGSEHPPRLVILRYRPKGKASAARRPIALVGKGVTFDTGGLDIKPSSGMRWMKKDMGGSAALVGLAAWAFEVGLSLPLDIYLPLAENAVSGKSFAPGDVLLSRQGKTVEIHNTDAEGRLLLADALSLATAGAQKPSCVVDVATLTGAIKVALGADLAGLFSNDSKLALELQAASVQAGDLVWPMPLVQKYRGAMKSQFADMNNAVDGFGGAITAALFLQDFVNDVPWAHLDIYAWKDGAEACWGEAGGSGQAVSLLARWLLDQAGR